MKNLRFIGTTIALAFTLVVSTNAEIIHIDTSDDVNGRDVTIPEGKLLHVIFAQGDQFDSSFIQVDGTTVVKFNSVLSPSPGSNGSTTPATPGVLRDLKLNGTTVKFGQDLLVTYEIIDTPSTTTSATSSLERPSDAVVVPADDKGSVKIILESSTDLITWIRAVPGTYATSFTRRFFRVRAERQTE